MNYRFFSGLIFLSFLFVLCGKTGNEPLDVDIPIEPPASKTLGNLAKAKNLNFGTMVHKPQFTGTGTSYKQLLLDEFTMVFPENEIKWDKIEPARNVFAFDYPDQVIDFARSNGKTSRGHFMIWHTNLPAWLTNGNWSRNELLAILKNHIFTVMGHYKGKILEYDVVNEPFNLAQGNPYGLRSNMWYNIIGPEYIDSAFVWANQADPGAYLYLNEYGAEPGWSGDFAKRDSVHHFVKKLKDRGVPIHGVGLECHFGDYVNTNAISENIKKLGELGLRVSITELDMMNTSLKPDNWKNLLKVALSNYNCTSFVTWGVDDANSWKGSDCGCLIWREVGKVKTSIYDALIAAFNESDKDNSIASRRKVFAAIPPAASTLKPAPKGMTVNLAIVPNNANTQIIIDNTHAACTVESPWTASTYMNTCYRSSYMHDGSDKANPDRLEKFTPTNFEEWNYRVLMHWTVGPGRTTKAPVEIKNAQGKTKLYADQSVNGGSRNYLEIYKMTIGSDNNAELMEEMPDIKTADGVIFEKTLP